MSRLRYNIARTLIHVGLWIMPDSRYKRDLLELLWMLRAKVEEAQTDE